MEVLELATNTNRITSRTTNKKNWPLFSIKRRRILVSGKKYLTGKKLPRQNIWGNLMILIYMFLVFNCFSFFVRFLLNDISYLYTFLWAFTYRRTRRGRLFLHLPLLHTSRNTHAHQAPRANMPSSIYRKHSTAEPALHRAAKHVRADSNARGGRGTIGRTANEK